MYGADNRKGGNFTLMKMFWQSSPPNQYTVRYVGKIRRKLSYFLPAATDWDIVAKGRPISFGLTSYKRLRRRKKKALNVYESVSSSEGNIRRFPAVALPGSENILHSFLLKQPEGCFIMAYHCAQEVFKLKFCNY